MRTALAVIALILSPSLAAAEDTTPVAEIIKEKCALCHGAEGEASSAIYPRIAGQNRVYLAKQLKNFRDGTRVSDTMNAMADDLTDEQIAGLAEHFSSQAPLAHRIRRSKKPLAGVGEFIFRYGNEYTEIPPCTSCHGENGEGDENLPRLAGQHQNYVISQLEAFHERKRTNDNAIMHTIAKNLTMLEMDAVALYVSGLRPAGNETVSDKEEPTND
ncbi:MAG: cytochrome c, class I [Hyphomicrobiales bacterium]|nr:MAG: cytochrome c, class I [Hyphomicrobiales bacterium]